ncbi:alpha-ketoglutarate-dependent dioxygenase AlkB [Sphingobacterium sp. lm-10]|uniref:alpha-ketoglutarate-dependent dioxygenase AlkB family protein n=1 Tax=Sphingobacterium sp. lm-10 TaxID=2944904 RepID=UPI0020221E59|nr:alpha-ketoglutarate-dependent dioxygenase AlkB [Sphingobacterium sp. lm-10]MCL7987789.1 alpha-ketoglutarate-dependent dioxygenase AlkB [Sphingobacterium sp. lm-10]
MGSREETVEYLPQDGSSVYYGTIWSTEEANGFLMELLENIAWKQDEALMFGKRILTKRKVAWYGDHPFEYTYSNTTKRALPWTTLLQRIKQEVELVTGETFNSCLLNLYHDGSEGMAWHSDSESELKKYGAIASVSFGAQRKFAFKHKASKEKIDIQLEHGSLLVMSGTTQQHWLHRIPPTKKIHGPRVNLTFRTIVKR